MDDLTTDLLCENLLFLIHIDWGNGDVLLKTAIPLLVYRFSLLKCLPFLFFIKADTISSKM